MLSEPPAIHPTRETQMTTIDPERARARGPALRQARMMRTRMIRRRVIAAALSLFVATWLLITIMLVSGHDPALAAHRTSSAAQTSTAGQTTTATGDTGDTGDTGATTSTAGTTSTTSQATASSGTTSSVTTQQS